MVSMLVRTGGMAQAIEHLPGKHKVLSSNPSTDKKKVWHSRKYRHMGSNNRIESKDIDPQICGQYDFDKSAMAIQWEKE
jgi:hypothetical protein